MRRSISSWCPVATLVVVAALGLTACGDDSASSGSSESTASPGGSNEIYDQLPEDVKKRGYVTFAVDANYPPIASFGDDGKTLEGLEPELAVALGKHLGVEVRLTPAAFDSIIPGIQGGKYDAGMSWMTDTEERREVVDFVDYARAAASLVALATLTNPPTALPELCGLSVAIQGGVSSQPMIEAEQPACKAAGKPIDLQLYPDQAAANLAVDSGRADVVSLDSPGAVLLVEKSNGKLVVAGTYGEALHGIALAKGSDLVRPIALAFQATMEDGSGPKIFESWGLGPTAVADILINGEPIT